MAAAVKHFLICREQFCDSVQKFTNKHFAVKQILLCRTPPHDDSSGTRCKLYDLDSIIEKARSSSDDTYLETIIKEEICNESGHPGDLCEEGGSPEAVTPDPTCRGRQKDGSDQKRKVPGGEGPGERWKKRRLSAADAADTSSSTPTVDSLIATLESGDYAGILDSIGGDGDVHPLGVTRAETGGVYDESVTDPHDVTPMNLYYHGVKQEPRDTDDYKEASRGGPATRARGAYPDVSSAPCQEDITPRAGTVCRNLAVLAHRCPFCAHCPEFDHWNALLQHVCDTHFFTGEMKCPYQGCKKVFKIPPTKTFSNLKTSLIPSALCHFNRFHGVEFPEFFVKVYCPEPGCDFVHVSHSFLRKHMLSTHTSSISKEVAMSVVETTAVQPENASFKWSSYSVESTTPYPQQDAVTPERTGRQSMSMLQHRCPFCEDNPEFDHWNALLQHVCDTHFSTGEMKCPYQGCKKVYKIPPTKTFSNLKTSLIPSALCHFNRFHGVEFPEFFVKVYCPEPGCDFVHVSHSFLRKHMLSTHSSSISKEIEISVVETTAVQPETASFNWSSYSVDNVTPLQDAVSSYSVDNVTPLLDAVSSYSVDNVTPPQDAVLPIEAGRQNMFLSEFRCPFCEESPPEFEHWNPLLQHVCDMHFPDKQMKCPHHDCKRVFNLPPTNTLSNLKNSLIPSVLHHFHKFHRLDFPPFFLTFPCPEPGCGCVHISKALLRKHMSRSHSTSANLERESVGADITRAAQSTINWSSYSEDSTLPLHDSALPIEAGRQNMFLSEFRCPFCEDCPEFEHWNPLLQHVCEWHFPDKAMKCRYHDCKRLFNLPPSNTLSNLKNSLIPSILHHFHKFHRVEFPEFFFKFYCPEPGCGCVHVSKALLRKHMASVHSSRVDKQHEELGSECIGDDRTTKDPSYAVNSSPDPANITLKTEDVSCDMDSSSPPVNSSTAMVENTSHSSDSATYAPHTALHTQHGAYQQSVAMTELCCPFCVDSPRYERWNSLLQHVCDTHFPAGAMPCQHPQCTKIFKLPPTNTFSNLKTSLIPSTLYHYKRFHNVEFPEFFVKVRCPEPGCDFVHVSSSFLRKHMLTTHPACEGGTETMSAHTSGSVNPTKVNAGGNESSDRSRPVREDKQDVLPEVREDKQEVLPEVREDKQDVVPEAPRTTAHSSSTEVSKGATPRSGYRPTTVTSQYGAPESYHNYIVFHEHRCMICNHDTVYEGWDQLGTHIRDTHFDVIEDNNYAMACPHEKCPRKFTIPVDKKKKPRILKRLLPSIVYHFFCKHNVAFPPYIAVFNCPDAGCTYATVSLAQLAYHRDKQTTHNPNREPRLVCDQCGKMSKSRACLRIHKAYHCKAVVRSPADRIRCAECDKDFGSPRGLHGHMRSSHLGTAPKFICQYCSKAYTCNQGLDEHIFTVHGENLSDRPVLTCPHCPQQALTEKRLNTHIRNRHTAQNFTCKICQQTFSKIGALERHLETHSDRVYQCELCSYSTKHKRCFYKHQQAQHSDKRYNCNYCSYTSGYRENTMKHMKHCAPKHGQVA